MVLTLAERSNLGNYFIVAALRDLNDSFPKIQLLNLVILWVDFSDTQKVFLYNVRVF